MPIQFSKPTLIVIGQLLSVPRMTRPKILLGKNWYTFSGVHTPLDDDNMWAIFFFMGDGSSRIGSLRVPEDFEIWIKSRE